MTAQPRTYWDLVCDHDGCGTELTAYSESGYQDERHAREEAEDYDWQHINGDDLCPDHRRDVDDDEEQL